MTTQPWGGASGGLPPELEFERERLRRQQSVADALLAQSQQYYRPQMAGGYVVPYSPLSAIAKIVQGYGAQKTRRDVDTGMADLGRRYNEGLAEAVRQYSESATTTKPAIESPPDEIGGGPGRDAMTVQADPRARVAQAMASPYAPVRDMAKLDYQMGEKRADRAEDRAFRASESAETRAARAQEAQLARDARRQDLELRLADSRTNAADRMAMQRELAQMRIDAQREMRSMTAASTPVTAVTVMENGKAVIKDARTGRTIGEAPASKQGNAAKLPTSALKLQQEELEAIGLASSINADLSGIEQQITEGKLNPSLVGNAIASARNTVGMSTPESRNVASFKATLEKMRNDSLRLNKGVQTEGDAQRAWNELIANINDKGVVQQRLAEIKKINERAANLRRMNVDAIRGNYGLDPMDVSGFQNQPSAVGAPPAAAGGWSVKPLP